MLGNRQVSVYHHPSCCRFSLKGKRGSFLRGKGYPSQPLHHTLQFVPYLDLGHSSVSSGWSAFGAPSFPGGPALAATYAFHHADRLVPFTGWARSPVRRRYLERAATISQACLHKVTTRSANRSHLFLINNNSARWCCWERNDRNEDDDCASCVVAPVVASGPHRCCFVALKQGKFFLFCDCVKILQAKRAFSLVLLGKKSTARTSETTFAKHDYQNDS